MFINLVNVIPPQTVPRVTHTTPRHLPDIFQTHYRHYKILQILTNPRQLGLKEAAIINVSQWMFINCLHIIPLQTVSRVTQKTPRPPRHPTDTPEFNTSWPIRGNLTDLVCIWADWPIFCLPSLMWWFGLEDYISQCWYGIMKKKNNSHNRTQCRIILKLPMCRKTLTG